MQAVEQWLSVATRGLCASAAERVHAEIGDHYQSALESAQAAGLDVVEAERSAVAALGHAKAANREYRRVLLTKGEDRLLRWAISEEKYLGGPSRSRTALMLAALATHVIISIWKPALTYFEVALFLELIIFPTLHARSIGAGRIIRAMRWGVLAVGGTMTILSGRHAPIVVCLLLQFAYIEYKHFILRYKLPVDKWPKRFYN